MKFSSLDIYSLKQKRFSKIVIESKVKLMLYISEGFGTGVFL